MTNQPTSKEETQNLVDRRARGGGGHACVWSALLPIGTRYFERL